MTLCRNKLALRGATGAGITGTVLAAAWIFPSTLLAVVLGWCGALALVSLLQNERRLWPVYLAGVLFQPIGFIWLLHTIATFGGFPLLVALPIFLFFVVISALQFLVVGLVYRWLPRYLDTLCLRPALAWLCGEMLAVRIFPWYLGHTQSAWTGFAQAAAWIGAPGISLLMVWSATAAGGFLGLTPVTHRSLRSIGALLCIVLAVSVGSWRAAMLGQEKPTIPISVIQGNLSIAQKGNLASFDENLEAYFSLSQSEYSPNRLVIWPESVFTQFLSTSMSNVSDDARLHFWNPDSNLLFGALTFESRERYFNSAVAIRSDGSIPPPYHKQILMPFGEYTPFAAWLPWVAALNSTVANFTPGERMVPLVYPNLGNLIVAPLICYEDIVSGLGRSAVENGAEVLINITNDAWFGESLAPYQHHAIATFRAIETGRYLVRSTNTGFTAVVDPRGQTVASLPTWQPGVLRTVIAPRQEKTAFVAACFDSILFWSAVTLAALAVGGALVRRRPLSADLTSRTIQD